MITKEFIKKETLRLGLTLVMLFAIFKMCFYKENFLFITKTLLTIFWLFILPGYFILLNYELDFIERIILGSATGMAVYAVLSYSIGLTGINVKYHIIIIPVAVIIFSSIILYKKNMNYDSDRLSE